MKRFFLEATYLQARVIVRTAFIIGVIGKYYLNSDSRVTDFFQILNHLFIGQ